jgi:hypothetical protein
VGVSMAIPSAQNSVVGAIATDAIGKAAGANSMMRELGGVFGVALVVAVFAATGGYASAATFTDGFGPAIGVAAALALIGAVAGLALPKKNKEEITQCDKSWSATRSSLSASPTTSVSCAPSTTS